jgi:hypothetical protein
LKKMLRLSYRSLLSMLCFILLFQLLSPVSSFAHDSSKRDDAAEVKLYQKWMDMVEHELIEQGILDEKDHLHEHSQNEPVDRAAFIKWLIKATIPKKELDKAFKLSIACPFSDVKDTDVCNYLQLAKKMELTSGYPDGTFQPQKSITRAETLAFAVKILPYKLTSDGVRQDFFDVGTKHWAYNAVTLGVQLKLMKGLSDGTFKPDQPAKNSEVMSVLYDILKLMKQEKTQGGRTAKSPFSSTTLDAVSLASDFTIVWNSGMNPIGNIVAPSEKIPLEIEVLNPQSVKYQLKWNASAGEISQQSGLVALWTAPLEEGEYTVSVTATTASSLQTTVTEHFVVSFLALEEEFKFSDPANFIPPEEDDIDSDGDGLMDSEEKQLGTDPLQKDTDHDGLEDYLEVEMFGTNPLLWDSDGDGISDGVLCDSTNHTNVSCLKK